MGGKESKDAPPQFAARGGAVGDDDINNDEITAMMDEVTGPTATPTGGLKSRAGSVKGGGKKDPPGKPLRIATDEECDNVTDAEAASAVGEVLAGEEAGRDAALAGEVAQLVALFKASRRTLVDIDGAINEAANKEVAFAKAVAASHRSIALEALKRKNDLVDIRQKVPEGVALCQRSCKFLEGYDKPLTRTVSDARMRTLERVAMKGREAKADLEALIETVEDAITRSNSTRVKQGVELQVPAEMAEAQYVARTAAAVEKAKAEESQRLAQVASEVVKKEETAIRAREAATRKAFEEEAERKKAAEAIAATNPEVAALVEARKEAAMAVARAEKVQAALSAAEQHEKKVRDVWQDITWAIEEAKHERDSKTTAGQRRMKQLQAELDEITPKVKVAEAAVQKLKKEMAAARGRAAAAFEAMQNARSVVTSSAQPTDATPTSPAPVSSTTVASSGGGENCGKENDDDDAILAELEREEAELHQRAARAREALLAKKKAKAAQLHVMAEDADSPATTPTAQAPTLNMEKVSESAALAAVRNAAGQAVAEAEAAQQQLDAAEEEEDRLKDAIQDAKWNAEDARQNAKWAREDGDDIAKKAALAEEKKSLAEIMALEPKLKKQAAEVQRLAANVKEKKSKAMAAFAALKDAKKADKSSEGSSQKFSGLMETKEGKGEKGSRTCAQNLPKDAEEDAQVQEERKRADDEIKRAEEERKRAEEEKRELAELEEMEMERKRAEEEERDLAELVEMEKEEEAQRVAGPAAENKCATECTEGERPTKIKAPVATEGDVTGTVGDTDADSEAARTAASAALVAAEAAAEDAMASEDKLHEMEDIWQDKKWEHEDAVAAAKDADEEGNEVAAREARTRAAELEGDITTVASKLAAQKEEVDRLKGVADEKKAIAAQAYVALKAVRSKGACGSVPPVPAAENEGSDASLRVADNATGTSRSEKDNVTLTSTKAMSTLGLSNSEDGELYDPNSVDNMVSNAVLEWEVARLDAQIAKLKRGKKAVDDLEDRKMNANIRMQILVAQVQTGQLTVPAYIKSLKEKVAVEKLQAVKFNKQGKREWAALAVKRYKLMEQEIKDTEAYAAAEGTA